MAELVPVAISAGLNLIASLFSPKPKPQEVELRVPRSDYGAPLVKIYGKVRIEGNKFWPDTKERMYRKSSSSSKGKGGGGGGKGGQKKDSFFGTFAVLFCQGDCSMDRLIINGDVYDTGHPYYAEYVTFFDGTQDAPWSEMTAKDEPPFNQIAYTKICYVGFTDLPLEKYGNQIPQQISAILRDEELGDTPRLADVITSICIRAGLVSDNIDVSSLGDIRLDSGLIVPESGEGYRKVLEDLFQIYLLTAFETKDGIIKIIRFGENVPTIPVAINQYIPVSTNGVDNKIFTRTEINPSQIPNQVTFKFFNINKNYDTDEVTEFTDEIEELRTIDFVKENNVTVDTRFFSTPEQMSRNATNLLKHLHKQQRYEYNFKLPATILSNSTAELMNLIQLPNGEIVQLETMAVGADYLIDCKARYFAGTTTYNNPPPTPIPPTPVPDPTLDIPILYILDTPIFKQNTIPGTLLIFAKRSCVVFVSLDGGASFIKEISHTSPSTYGNVTTVLTSTATSVDIVLENGQVNSVTLDQINANLNLALIGKIINGVYEGELIQFQNVQVLSLNTYRLSGLTRGLFNTRSFINTHSLPEKFFLLTGETNAYYSELQGDARYLNETITLLPVVAPYQDLATTPRYTITPRGNSFRPVPPTNPTGTIDPEGSIQLFWEYNPPYNPYNNSGERVTFEVDIYNGVNVVRTITSDVTQCLYPIADRTADGVTPPLEVAIYAISQVVGRGEPLFATITPVLVPSLINDGILTGVFFVTADYTVVEERYGNVLIVQSSATTPITITFPSTLRNGFYCYVVSDSTNNATFVVNLDFDAIYTDVIYNEIKTGDGVSLYHTTGGNYFVLAGSKGDGGGGTGNGLSFAFFDANFTSDTNTINAVSTTGGAVTATLPPTPDDGAIVGFYDYDSTFKTNPLTITPSAGQNIIGETELILDTDNSTAQLVFYEGRWSLFGTEVFVDRIGLSLGGGGGGGTPVPVPDASETDKGIARLATLQDVLDGTEPSEIVTPATLKAKLDTLSLTVPDATDIVKGIVARATVQEVKGLAITDKFVVPSRLPLSETNQQGLARIATTQEVKDEIIGDAFVTPATLREWRIENGLSANALKVGTIYVSGNAFHTLSGNRRGEIIDGKDPNHGDSVTYAQFLANQNNPLNDGNFWQVVNPDSQNFRSFKTLQDVASYGNANFDVNENVTLFIDSGKYRCDYTFNFGLIINGVNNTGEENWGDPDGTSEGIILYSTSSFFVDSLSATIRIASESMIINSQISSNLSYVHFWTWVTACKDSTLSWGNIKNIGENTIEQHFLNIDNIAYTANSNLLREKYNGYFAGIGTYNSLLRLQGEGEKKLNYCTFSGIGTSAPKINLSRQFNGGYIFVESSCKLSIKGIVFRGNEIIRISDKRGRKVFTFSSPTVSQFIPSNITERGDESTWTYENIYDSSGNFRPECIGSLNLDGVFHDPYSEEWVTIGFCDDFIGVAQNVELIINFSEDFLDNLSFFGTNQPASFLSTSPTGSFSLNHDLKNIRIEKWQGKLFGLTDDRVINGETSATQTGIGKYRFRGTDILGKKIANLYPPVLTFTGQTANPSQQSAFNSWVTAFRNQGSTIRRFITSDFNYSLSLGEEFSLWADRDCSGLITGQGFIGQFGYLLQTQNIKLQPILSYDFLSVYGSGINFNEQLVSSKLISGQQYHYNMFRGVWAGFDEGKYTHPVIIDVGINYNSFLADKNSNPPNFTAIANQIINNGYLLNGANIGARFVFVGIDSTEWFSLMYIGYGISPTEYYFIDFGNNAGVTDYFNATKIDNISDLTTLTGAPNKLYIRDSNLLLTNENYSSDVTDIKNWQPDNLNINHLPVYNTLLTGLVTNNYKVGFFVDKYGIRTNLNNFNSISDTEIEKPLTTIYTNAGYPDNLNLSSAEYQTVQALLKSGFYGKTLYSGFACILPRSNVQITG